MTNGKELTRTEIADLIDNSRHQLPIPDVSSVHTRRRRRSRNRRLAAGAMGLATVSVLLFLIGTLGADSELLETVSPIEEESVVERTISSLILPAVPDLAWNPSTEQLWLNGVLYSSGDKVSIGVGAQSGADKWRHTYPAVVANSIRKIE